MLVTEADAGVPGTHIGALQSAKTTKSSDKCCTCVTLWEAFFFVGVWLRLRQRPLLCRRARSGNGCRDIALRCSDHINNSNGIQMNGFIVSE